MSLLAEGGLNWMTSKGPFQPKPFSGSIVFMQKAYLPTTLPCGLFISKINLEGKKKKYLISCHLEQLVVSAINTKIRNSKA